MKGSILSSILYTMAFSLGTSQASSSPLEKRDKDAVSWFDEPGLAKRVLECDRNSYTKIVAYATVNHALTSGKGKGRKRWCQSSKCVTFPAPFTNQQPLFRVQGPYEIFPIKPDGTLYMGGNPGPDFVVYNREYVVAGVIKHGYRGYSKCLYNDQIPPPATPFMTRITTKFNEIARNPFAGRNQDGTTTTESGWKIRNPLTFPARKIQDGTTTTESGWKKHNPLNYLYKNKQQQDKTVHPSQESEPILTPPPAYEENASTSQ